MTSVLTRPAPPAVATPPRFRAGALLPWALVTVVYVAALLNADTPARDIAIYGVYLVLGIVVPGTLVWRAVRGSRGNLPEDLGLGAGTGLFVQLVGWAIAAAIGLQQVLWAWPLLVIAAFIAVPSLRRHWRIDDPRPLPLRWAWMICAALLVIVAWGAVAWSGAPMPPFSGAYYQDVMYHLSLVHEMTRSMPFEVPQLAGDTLRYHYLSDADMAAASMITGIPEHVVLLRLWNVPIGAIGVLVTAVLAREVIGKWWAGPLAGALAFIGIPLSLGAPLMAYGTSALVFASPSQTYAMPLLGLLALIAVDVLRGRPLGPLWYVTPPLALAVAGSKSSALPPLVAGIGLAGLVLWIRHRKFPLRIALFLVAVLIPMIIGTKLFAGGGAGTLGLQPFAVIRWMDPYSMSLGQNDGIAPNGFLPPGLAGADAKGWVFAVGIIGWWLLMESPRLLGILGIGNRRMRADPVAWMFGGMIVAGTAATWLLWHPSASMLYFFLCMVPFGSVLTVWLLAENVRRWWVPVAGLLAGAAWALIAPAVARPEYRTSWSQWSWALGLPVLRTLGFVVAGAILVLVLRKSYRSLVVAVVAAVVGASLAYGTSSYTKSWWNAEFGPAPAAAAPARQLTRAEMRAALWLDENAGNDAVVATNVHCQPIGRAKPCDARAFWVAGLGGRRTLVESWGYSDATVAANGVNGIKYPLQPAPDPALFALNERVFTVADVADVRALREAYGVKWLFADSRAGTVSPQLAMQAKVAYTAGSVTIYELE
ncbi:hypothetical protein GCM10010435_89580 [Winogradskya consettensis]|uniref:Uncharacterized protein n=1 Tax=Winogradskya consettensis TaxID=113560 RepID=A0A919W2Z2_9ACTN|nr:hypothetical protein [Actinoplanes consettensis]GIM77878.1 hypothetical protein Aco04nite_57610 [Actinoplanes consettensis]